MKEKYIAPDMELIYFEAEDVITASNVGNGSSNELSDIDIFQ